MTTYGNYKLTIEMETETGGLLTASYSENINEDDGFIGPYGSLVHSFFNIVAGFSSYMTSDDKRLFAKCLDDVWDCIDGFEKWGDRPQEEMEPKK